MGKQQPQAPDPIQTANAQTQSNKDTAVAQTQLNNVNQVTPNGNLTYTSTPGANGVPQYTATTTLSPAQQKLLETTQGTTQSLANTAQTQAGRLDTALAQPFSLDNDAVEGRLMELGRKRLDPLLADRRQSAETDLLNRGIRPGSTNYDQAHDILNQGENDAYDQLLLQGRQQSVSEALAARNQPINEILALAGQGQVQQPQFASTPQTGVAGTDVSGLISNNYNQQMQNYKQQQSDFYGGLFGLGKAAIGLIP